MTLPHDRQIAEWLADDAHEGQADSLARALAATRRTRKRPRWTFPETWLPMRLTTVGTPSQERPVLGRPWTYPGTPSRLAKLTVVAVGVLAVGLVGLTLLRSPSVGPVASPSPTASPSPSPPPPPLTERFDSVIHGISVAYPSGWQVRPATAPWSDEELDFDSPAADIIFDPAHEARLYLVVASQPFAAPIDAQDWDGTGPGDWDGIDHVPMCLPGEGGHGLGGPFPVDDGRAFELQACGSFAAAVNWKDARGYVIALVVRRDPGLREAFDHEYFDAVLETVDLRPEEALDAS